MRVAIAQLNQVVGDLSGNAARIVEATAQARRGGAHLLVTAELSLCGYPPEDLLLRPAFLSACADELARIAFSVEGITVLVGFPELTPGGRYNAVAILRDRKIAGVYRKQCLPNYTVFDEQRYFTAGGDPCVIEIDGVRVGIIICEDVWCRGPCRRDARRRRGADRRSQRLTLPYTSTGATQADRLDARAGDGLGYRLREPHGRPGRACLRRRILRRRRLGKRGAAMPAWHDTLAFAEFDGAVPKHVRGEIDERLEPNVYAALVMGVRDYVGKNGFPGVLLGLSGGIDSALTLAVAVDALGRDRVRALMLPSVYNAAISLEDARTMAGTLGVRYDEMPIDAVVEAFKGTLSEEFKDLAEDATEENIQARIRGTLLMALSNKYRAIVLTTGNKSEMAVGYATLYGDMAGGFAVLKDIDKTLVYRLARYRNSLGRVIPERIITRPPSAELRADQTDQDSFRRTMSSTPSWRPTSRNYRVPPK